jgi:lysophospholipase L1-like esterase
MQTALYIWKRALTTCTAFGLMVLAAGCGSDDKLLSKDAGLGTTGSADFTSYVAIGNSLTAGLQSAALTTETNDFAYPNLIANQVGTPFVQPEIDNPGIGEYTSRGLGILELAALALPPSIAPLPLTTAQLADVSAMLSNASHAAPYNNLGIPGALSVEIPSVISSGTSLSGNNIFFDIVLRNPNLGNTYTNVIQQALLLNPTFATVWLGNNDVLGYAAAGGVAPGLPIPVADVQLAIGAVLQAITAGGADVVIANIPSILSAPYFTTIKPFRTFPGTSIPILDASNAKQYFIGPTGAKLTDADLVTLPAQSALEAGAGTSSPLPNQYVLNTTEQFLVNKSIDDYNTAISGLATQYGALLVDVNALFRDIYLPVGAGRYIQPRWDPSVGLRAVGYC